MSNITDWIKYELYPTLFDSVDVIFPEHDFKRFAGGWRSKTYLNGTKHANRQDKTVITKNAPHCLLEQGGAVVGLVDYVMNRDNIDFISSVKLLADAVGLQIPQKVDFNDENKENYQKYKDQITLLEDCNSYFIYCLENSKNAENILNYLISRGYDTETIKNMELGYIPSQKQLLDYLEKKGYTQNLINDVVSFQNDTRIGTTHTLTIAYRSGGVIKGFKFRTIKDEQPKYLNSAGLDKISGFFNLSGIKGNKEIIIVEGELDALHASVKGIDNVVAMGGSSINEMQIKDAIKRGAKSFSICLDYEQDKQEETLKKVNQIIQIILVNQINRVYVVTLPNLDENANNTIKNAKTDPDRLIKEQGINALKMVTTQALPYFEYQLYQIILPFSKLQEQRELSNKDIDNLLDKVVENALNIPDIIDRSRYKKLFTSFDAIKNLGITEESLSITLDKLTATKDKENQVVAFKKLLSEATELQKKGEIDKALTLLDNKVKEVKLKDKTTEFSHLLLTINEKELKNRQANKPNSLDSGYKIGEEELLLPAGAISIVAAPTSHGKTTFLINLALNVAQNYPNKEIYFFSYEEDGDSILINAFNTYLNKDISANNRKSIKHYFATNSTEYIKDENKIDFIDKKEQFFNEIITSKRLNINYVAYDIDTLVESIRYLHKNTNIGAIFIDYIQLLNLPEGKYKTHSRQEEIKEICISLKDIAIETGLPIILGAQFNREVSNQLKIHATKIGEAGDIERIANLIIGFWNNNFKGLTSESEAKEINNNGFDAPDTLYTVILKNRGGKAGLSNVLLFNGNTGKIQNKEENKLVNPF